MVAILINILPIVQSPSSGTGIHIFYTDLQTFTGSTALCFSCKCLVYSPVIINNLNPRANALNYQLSVLITQL